MRRRKNKPFPPVEFLRRAGISFVENRDWIAFFIEM